MGFALGNLDPDLDVFPRQIPAVSAGLDATVIEHAVRVARSVVVELPPPLKPGHANTVQCLWNLVQRPPTGSGPAQDKLIYRQTAAQLDPSADVINHRMLFAMISGTGDPLVWQEVQRTRLFDPSSLRGIIDSPSLRGLVWGIGRPDTGRRALVAARDVGPRRSSPALSALRAGKSFEIREGRTLEPLDDPMIDQLADEAERAREAFDANRTVDSTRLVVPPKGVSSTHAAPALLRFPAAAASPGPFGETSVSVASGRRLAVGLFDDGGARSIPSEAADFLRNSLDPIRFEMCRVPSTPDVNWAGLPVDVVCALVSGARGERSTLLEALLESKKPIVGAQLGPQTEVVDQWAMRLKLAGAGVPVSDGFAITKGSLLGFGRARHLSRDLLAYAEYVWGEGVLEIKPAQSPFWTDVLPVLAKK